jgi:hypothetical protein
VLLVLVMVSIQRLENIISLETPGVPIGVTKVTSKLQPKEKELQEFVVFNIAVSTQPSHEKLKELR